jgi:SAM-dependent methyltransferase
LNAAIERAVSKLPADALILDCGGWFKPLGAATHVVDLMPYETRSCAVNHGPLPGERFTRETWYQMDFAEALLRLPFDDGQFAFSICSHTIEDLANPAPLLRELIRVSRAGCLAAPSRLSEQTAGARDRMTSRCGHPHHRWICETGSERPVLSSKADSLDGAWWRTAVPLRRAQRLQALDSTLGEWVFVWKESFTWSLVRGDAARERATAFARRTGTTRRELLLDATIRLLRRAKWRLNAGRRRGGDWWVEMVRLSQPYSRLPLR